METTGNLIVGNFNKIIFLRGIRGIHHDISKERPMNIRSFMRGLCCFDAVFTHNFISITIAFPEAIAVNDIAGSIVEVEKNPLN